MREYDDHFTCTNQKCRVKYEKPIFKPVKRSLYKTKPPIFTPEQKIGLIHNLKIGVLIGITACIISAVV